MSLLELLIPAINEIWIPLVIILVGVGFAFLGGLIPFIGGKISTFGWLIVVVGVLYWILSVKLTELLSLITPNVILISVLGIIIIFSAITLLSKKKK